METNQSPDSPASLPEKRAYRWPWFVLAAVIAAVVLAILWMRHEVERTRRLRDLNQPAAHVSTPVHTLLSPVRLAPLQPESFRKFPA